MELKPGIARGSGHSSRIFSVKFHPDDPNIIVSGGWVGEGETTLLFNHNTYGEYQTTKTPPCSVLPDALSIRPSFEDKRERASRLLLSWGMRNTLCTRRGFLRATQPLVRLDRRHKISSLFPRRHISLLLCLPCVSCCTSLPLLHGFHLKKNNHFLQHLCITAALRTSALNHHTAFTCLPSSSRSLPHVSFPHSLLLR